MSADPRSPFHWNNGKRSIFWSETEERAARKLAKASGGMALDVKGRPLVEMGPRTAQAIVIRKQADADKSHKISKGRAI
jgi:hypothetical protein